MNIKKVTIKDVAKKANVSISTVSNALNNVNVLHPDTKAHILEIAKEMNYIPNLHGRNLKSTSTKVLGLFVRSIKGPYYGTLIDSISTECDKYGYDLNVFITKNEGATINNILGRSVSGAIIFNEWISHESLVLLERSGIPLVFLDREKVDENISSVIFASYEGGKTATQYLVNLGHKKISYIHGVKDLYDDKERFRGFKEVLDENGYFYYKNNCLVGNFEEDVTFYEVQRFIRNATELPDAFFAANDLSAVGCIKALQSEGYSVPKDISVIGFDDIEISSYFNNGMTTIRNPIVKQGKLAVDRLLGIIHNKQRGQLDRLEGKMVIRNSCTYNKNVVYKD